MILDIVMKMVRGGHFTSRDGTPFDKTILTDFIVKSRNGFAGKPTLPHCHSHSAVLNFSILAFSETVRLVWS